MIVSKTIKSLIFIAGLALIQTGIFLLMLFIFERTGIFDIQVVNFDHNLIYPYEVGGFFFLIIFLSDLIVEMIRKLIKGEN